MDFDDYERGTILAALVLFYNHLSQTEPANPQEERIAQINKATIRTILRKMGAENAIALLRD